VCTNFCLHVIPTHKQPLIPKSLNLTAKPFVRSTYSMPTSVSFIDKKTKETNAELNNNNNNNNYLTSPSFMSDKDYSSFSSSSSLSSSTNSLNSKCITPDETTRAKELITQRLAVMRIHPVSSSSSPPVRSANSSPLVNTPASPSSLTLNKSNNVSVLLNHWL
jgi:hypothetical protein